MSKSKSDDVLAEVAEAIVVPESKPAALGFPANGDVVDPLGPLRIFRDTVFTSRTLVMPNGRTLSVVAGRVAASGDEQYAYLTDHPELEQLPE